MKHDIDAVLQSFFSQRHCQTILVAYSGGPDSAVLLHALSRMSTVEQRLTIKACWVNHRLRSPEEMQAEQVLVEQFAGVLGIPLNVVTAEPGEIEVYRHTLGVSGGIEAAARAFRYEKLRETAQNEQCDVIATAHTRSDVIETMIMRFFAGSGVDGLCGIPEEQGSILRPLLEVTREDILAYINMWNIPVSYDSTNMETIYLRNKIRHKVLPVIETIFPNYDASLATLQKKARLDADALNEYARQLVITGTDSILLDYDAFLNSPRSIQIRALYLLLKDYKTRIPWHTVQQLVRDVVMHGKAMLGDVMICVRGKYIGIEGHKKTAYQYGNARFFSVFVEGPALFTIGAMQELEVAFSSRGPGLRKDALHMPFVIRSPKQGDRIRSKEGHTSVDELIASWKLTPEQRSNVLICEDIEGIIAVWGAHIGKKNIFRHNPNLLNSYNNDYITIAMKGV